METSPLTKKEKYFLRKQEKQEQELRHTRRKKIKKVIPIVLIGGALAGLVVFSLTGRSSDVNNHPSFGAPRIEVEPTEIDAGTISMANGPITHAYAIKNTGEGDLTISKIQTSCMCTTAVLTVGERKSQAFGMHTEAPFWSQKITPGESGQLAVTFDPAFHGPEGTGSMVRAVYLATDDPDNKQIEVRLVSEVTP